jgi:hypothetical protein
MLHKIFELFSVHFILIAECAQDPTLLGGNRHDMTVYSYAVNSSVEASDYWSAVTETKWQLINVFLHYN